MLKLRSATGDYRCIVRNLLLDHRCLHHQHPAACIRLRQQSIECLTYPLFQQHQPPPTPPKRLVPAPLPPNFRIAPNPTTPLRLIPFPSQNQRSFSAPSSLWCSQGPPRSLGHSDEVQEEEVKETALSAFQHWLSLLSEQTIPMPFRQVLA
jgi:hypothetical protein